MKKKNTKKELPAGWRVVNDKYEPKSGEFKTFSVDFGWVVTGLPVEEKAAGKPQKQGVTHGS